MVEEVIFKETEVVEQRRYSFAWRLGASFTGMMVLVFSPILFVITFLYVAWLTAKVLFMSSKSIDNILNKK
jgi:hypothetical protein